MSAILPLQNELQVVLPVVIGNAEFNSFKALLFRISEIIEQSGIEKQAIQYILDVVTQNGLKSAEQEGKITFELSEQMQMSIQEKARLALRVTIARKLTKQSYRSFADWVLLKAASRTIMKTVKLIRRHGLKNRMDDPADFIRVINKLYIEMTHTNDSQWKSRDEIRIW